MCRHPRVLQHAEKKHCLQLQRLVGWVTFVLTQRENFKGLIIHALDIVSL